MVAHGQAGTGWWNAIHIGGINSGNNPQNKAAYKSEDFEKHNFESLWANSLGIYPQMLVAGWRGLPNIVVTGLYRLRHLIQPEQWQNEARQVHYGIFAEGVDG